jgi:hypothetical protein
VVQAAFALGMVQFSVDNIVNMVTMGNGFVTASGTVLVGAAIVLGRTCGGIGCVYRDYVFVDMAFVRMVNVPVVEVVGVALVLDGSMPATRSVLMRMAVMSLTCHESLSFLWDSLC